MKCCADFAHLRKEEKILTSQGVGKITRKLEVEREENMYV